jgi:serine/threonine protein kinase
MVASGVLSYCAFQCILTARTSHCALWEKGIDHRDISPSNLMFYRTASGIVIGVLNDYDLLSIRNIPCSHERTGTVPFMAKWHSSRIKPSQARSTTCTGTMQNHSSGSLLGSAFLRRWQAPEPGEDRSMNGVFRMLNGAATSCSISSSKSFPRS